MMTRQNFLIGAGAFAIVGAGIGCITVQKMGSLGEYEASVAAMRASMPQTPEILDFVRYATLAASGHNTQPWKFRVGVNQIDILPDFSRRTPVVDPDDHHLFVSIGCAAENLSLGCGARGHPGEHFFDSSNDGAAVFKFGAGKAISSVLVDAIAKRQSSRTDYDGKSVSNSDLRALTVAAAVPGVDLILITDRPQIDRVRDLVVAGNSTQMSNRAFMRELMSWLRFNPRQALQTGDGLFSQASGNPSLPSWLGPMAFDWAFKPGAENDKCARQIASSAGIAVFVAKKEDHEHWVLAGRACQRFALQATALGLRLAFINQPVEVASLRPELADLVGLAGRRPDLVMRFGSGPTLPYSARRPAANVVIS
jgi:hypothetical protein